MLSNAFRMVHASRTALPRSGRGLVVASILFAVGLLTACGEDDPTGPVSGPGIDIAVLNSTGQSLALFRVTGNEIAPVGTPIDLGAGFDGDGFALNGSLAASTVSSFGGSRIVLVDLSSGEVSEAVFPGPDPSLVNPSRAGFDSDGSLWVGGRGSDAVYRLSPGDAVATRVAADVGTFVERVVPDGGELLAIDANLDDEGGSFAPLGRGRVVVLDRDGRAGNVIELPDEAPNPADGLLVAGRLVVLAGGTFDPITFTPNSDGSLVTVDPVTRQVVSNHPLGANGVRLALGADGHVYITTTTDYESLNLLRFDPGAGSFDRGPGDPIVTRDRSGGRLDCWTATALLDGRILCATFRTDAPGRLLLLESDGTAISETESGFGSTEIAIGD
jgi:sugar lactone lactonase YvrE